MPEWSSSVIVTFPGMKMPMDNCSSILVVRLIDAASPHAVSGYCMWMTILVMCVGKLSNCSLTWCIVRVASLHPGYRVNLVLFISFPLAFQLLRCVPITQIRFLFHNLLQGTPLSQSPLI